MKINLIKCKNILSKSKIPSGGYSINPYCGCAHNCVYCYACFMKRFTNHSEPWGQFIDIKINAPEVLPKDLTKMKKGSIFLSSVTDPYQPIEKRYKLTRKLLAQILKYNSNIPISILTKSALVTRDLNLLKQFKHCEVGLSITSVSSKDSRNFEPGASLPRDRIKALAKIHQVKGITTYASIAPLLPGVTNFEKILSALKGKVDYVSAEELNFKPSTKAHLFPLLTSKYPKLLPLYERPSDRTFWKKVETKFRKTAKQYGIPVKGFYRHT